MHKFIWEPECHPGFREIVEREIFQDRVYTKLLDVEEGDVVYDIGASLGPFTYSILDRKPKHVFAFEPSFEEFKTLVLNTRHGNVTQINKGISHIIGEFSFTGVFEDDGGQPMYSTTFMKTISDYSITKIDFLKTDCEGGEYDIFTFQNLSWIHKNVRKIVGEWHLGPGLKERFRFFRDIYLKTMPNFRVYSFDGVDITWDVWSENFINRYTEVMIHIDNRELSGE